jgi:hypothetical protein
METSGFQFLHECNSNCGREEIKGRLTWGLLAIILYRMFSFPVCYQKNRKIKIGRNVILPVVLYGCLTWSVTLREERSLRVFENRVLREVFGPEKDEGTGEWRRLHKEKIYSPYSSPNIIRIIKPPRKRYTGMLHMWGKKRCIQCFGPET